MNGVEFPTILQDPMVIECLKYGVPADEIQIIDCPWCGKPSYYSGGFTSGCSWCGRELAQYSDDAYTLSDWIYGQAELDYRDYEKP